MSEFDKRFNTRLKQYEKDYKIEDLNSSNDRNLLYILIRSELILEDLQVKLQGLVVDGDLVEQAIEIKKISDLIRDMTSQVTTIQRTLSIDRKSRKEESEESPIQYIQSLKKMSKDFLNERLMKVYCPHCKVMVFRFAPVHDHTKYVVSVKCSQCDRMITEKRGDKDALFDVPDADWRKHRAEIIHPESDAVLKELSQVEIIDSYNLIGGDDKTLEV